MKSALTILVFAASAFAAEGRAVSDSAGVERALNSLDNADWILQWEAIHDLAEQRAELAVPKLQSMLSEKNEPWLRSQALVALAGIRGKEILNSAQELAKSQDAVLRAGAFKALGAIGSDAALPAIEAAVKDADPGVRGEALVALAKISHEKSWPAVSAALGSDDPRSGILALPFVGGDAARDKLLALLDHKDKPTRLAVIAALKQARLPETLKPLVKRLLKEGDRAAQEAIQGALGAFPARARAAAVIELLAANEIVLNDLTLDLLSGSAEPDTCAALVKLLPQLEAGNGWLLARTIRIVASCDADQYAPLFTNYLKSSKADVRLAAIEGMGKCRKLDRFALLKPLITDPDARISETVFNAIRVATRWAPDEGIVSYLNDALVSKEKNIFKNAVTLLRDRLPSAEFPKALALLKPHLSGASTELRDLCVQALTQAADPEGARQIAAAQGYISQWHVLGPLTEKAGDAAIESFAPPEKDVDFTTKFKFGEEPEVAWAGYDLDRTDGWMDMQSSAGDEKGSSGCALAIFKIARAQTAVAQIASEGDFVFFVNGTKVAAEGKASTVDVQLKDGINRVLAKATRNDPRGRIAFRFRLADKQGGAIESTETVKTK